MQLLLYDGIHIYRLGETHNSIGELDPKDKPFYDNTRLAGRKFAHLSEWV